MHSDEKKLSVISRGSLPSPQYTSSSDSESDIVLELEQKRRQIEDEIAKFRVQKEKEFRDFERDLRASRRPKTNSSSSLSVRIERKEEMNKPPSRNSSSSALNLLAGRGTSKQPQLYTTSKKRAGEKLQQSKKSTTAGPSVSQPVVSLDKLNITGETTLPHPQPGRPRTPPTPTLLSRTLSRSSSSSSISTSPSPPVGHQRATPSTNRPSQPVLSDERKHRNQLTGLFTPSYLPLLESNPGVQYQSSSALETPPAEDEVSTAPSSYKSNLLNDVLALTSSSFPPHVTISPGSLNHASKRAYTAPTVPSHRKPSALRTASGGAISRKPKHVTFRLADSAIVEPSSSYEEGPSPQMEDEKPEKPRSGTRSPLRASKSQLHRTLSPDEEDQEAGVQPGMGMGDVIQRLNEYTVAEAAKNGEDLILEVDEDEQAESADGVDDEEDDDDDDDLPMVISRRSDDSHDEHTIDQTVKVNRYNHDDKPLNDIDDDGYFSPKSKHSSTMSQIPRGNSPLVPYRDCNWGELSSSDKDRLLFEHRRHSDDSDDMRRRSTIRDKNSNTYKLASPPPEKTGFSGGLRQNIDGGSGVGFFELDEELEGSDAGQTRPFESDNDPDEEDTAEDDGEKDGNSLGLGLYMNPKGTNNANDEIEKWSKESTSKFGVGSVPIDIVRPSLSVSSSWVGTFGH